MSNDQHDAELRPLLEALQQAGVDTDWSCIGAPGHMSVRPTVQCRTNSLFWPDFIAERRNIERVIEAFGIEHYWLSLNFNHGNVDTHGREPTWLIQIPGRFDFLALPVAYSIEYIDGEDDIVPDYRPLELLL